MKMSKTINIMSCSLASWWPYVETVSFQPYHGSDVTPPTYCIKKADHDTFPFRYLVNTTRCIYVGGPGGVVSFIKDNRVTITLRDMGFEVDLAKENFGIMQQMLDSHIKYYDQDTGRVKGT